MSHNGHDLDTSQTSTNNGRGKGEDYDAEKADTSTWNGGVDEKARIGNEAINGEAAGKNTTEEEPFDNDYEVRWDGDSDPLNPRNFGKAKKWLIVLVVSAGSTCVTCTSSMYTSTYEQITEEFDISRVVATLGLSLFVIGLGIGPMVLGPLSEFYGRRPIYIASFTFFLIWLVGFFSGFHFLHCPLLSRVRTDICLFGESLSWFRDASGLRPGHHCVEEEDLKEDHQ